MKRDSTNFWRGAIGALVVIGFTYPLTAQAWHVRAGGGARTFVVPAHPGGGAAPHHFAGAPPPHQAPSPHPSGQGPAQPHPPGPGPQPGPPPPHPPGPPPPPPHPPGPPPPPHSDDWYHPWATAAVIGATTATAVAIGTAVASVPKSCVPVLVNGISYQQCGSSWYQPQYVGTTLQYVVVVPPR